MKRSSSWARVWAWVALVALAGSSLVPGVAVAAPTAPQANPPKQIVLIDGTNKILVMNYAGGLYNILWTTGTIEGFQTGWSNFATGDFNGDGDQEIVATRYDQGSSRGQLKVFDPVIKGGAQPVDFTIPLSAGQSYNLLAVGDFEGLGRDQIIASYTYTKDNTFHEDLVEYFPVDSTGRAWGIQALDGFGSSLEAMTAGDLNRDGLADLAIVRNADRRLIVRSGQNRVWSTLYENSGYCCNWNALAVGKVLNDANHPGNDLVLVRNSPNTGFNSMVFFWWSLVDNNSTMDDLTPDAPAYFHFPAFNHLALANLDGNTAGLRQIVAMRELPDSAYANVSFVATLNPGGANIAGFEESGNYGLSAWKQVAAGDLTGDGRDEVVLLRSSHIRVYDRPWADAHHEPDLYGGFLPAALAVADIGFGATSVLTVTPTQLAFSNLQYGTLSDQSINVTNTGSTGPLSWTASKLTGTSWIKLNGGDTASGTTPGTLRVTVDATLAGVGTKSATVRVQSSDGTQAKDITVTVNVLDPGLYAVPNKVVLWHDKFAGTTTTGSIALSYPAGGAASWTISGKPTWLTVTPSSGTATVQPMAITFSADPAQVGNVKGVYNATIAFNAAGGSPASRSVQVTFIVADRVTRGWMPVIGR